MKELDDKISSELEEVAREEFLKLGFSQASLRNIVNKCGVSTQTVYSRYGNKEGLFNYLVDETGQAFLRLYRQLHQFHGIRDFNDTMTLTDYSSQATDQVLDFIYDHFEDFQLIFCKAEGTKYENYLEELINIEEKSMIDYLQMLEYPNLDDLKFFIHKKATEDIIDLYEFVDHGLSKEEAYQYMQLVKEFRFAGWKQVLKL